MKSQSLVLAAVLATSFGTVSAKTVDIDLQGGPLNWSTHLVGADHTAGTFSDTFTFSNYTAATSYVSVGLTNIDNGYSDITFTGATLNGINVPGLNIDPLSLVSFANMKVSGPLILTVNGFVTATRGNSASYSGSFAVTSAVPEPATYGMLIGGMGVLAFAARRRKQG